MSPSAWKIPLLVLFLFATATTSMLGCGSQSAAAATQVVRAKALTAEGEWNKMNWWYTEAIRLLAQIRRTGTADRPGMAEKARDLKGRREELLRWEHDARAALEGLVGDLLAVHALVDRDVLESRIPSAEATSLRTELNAIGESATALALMADRSAIVRAQLEEAIDAAAAHAIGVLPSSTVVTKAERTLDTLERSEVPPEWIGAATRP